MPEIKREEQFRRLDPFIFQWIKLFPRGAPFAVGELWDAAGQATATFSGSNLSQEQATARCQEYADRGLLERLPDGRFRTIAFTPANVEAFKKSSSTKPAEAFDLSGKEHEQKFRILTTLSQGRRDCLDWMEVCRQHNLPISLAFVDIDNFKEQFNKRYTNVVIDKTMLPEFMRLLQAHCTYRADACLQGGDEFLLVMPNCNKEEAYAFVERFRVRIREHVFQIEDAREMLTVSAGVATWPVDGKDFEQVMEAANRAEIRAKARKDVVEKAE